MENHFMLTDDLLWDYADGFLTPEEKIRVEAYLGQHPEWREKLDAILAEKRTFAALPLEKPQTGFADRVMAAWAAEQSHAGAIAPTRGKDWMIYVIMAAFGAFILLPVAAMVVSGLQSAPLELPFELPQAPDFDWDALLRNPILQYSLYLVFILLALKFAERCFQQRRTIERLKMGS